MTRISSSTLLSQAMNGLQITLAQISKNQARLSSGRQLLSPADDPAGHAYATRLQGRIDAIAQFGRQAHDAQQVLNDNDQMLASLNATLGRAQELTLSAVNDSQGPAERTAIANEIDQLLEETVAQANTPVNGRYLLGGRETQTPPLVVTRNVQGQITNVTWNPRGVDAPIDVAINEGVTVQTNLGGRSVLGDDAAPATFVPDVLIRIRDDLNTNNATAARAELANLQTATDALAAPTADTGRRLDLVTQTVASLGNDDASVRAALSSVLDADMARTAGDLQQEEVVYQAALHATARAIQPMLLEFLQ